MQIFANEILKHYTNFQNAKHLHKTKKCSTLQETLLQKKYINRSIWENLKGNIYKLQ